jgi:hypothetical protein
MRKGSKEIDKTRNRGERRNGGIILKLSVNEG